LGTSRDAIFTSKFAHLSLRDRVRIMSMGINDFRSMLVTLKSAAPDEIYKLA
jgi:GDPmannose 4,6-dehydratase